MDGIQPVLVESDDSPWHVIPHWALVDGKAKLVGIDIRCFVEECTPDGEEFPRRPVKDALVDLTQQVLRGISLSAVRAESQTYIAARFKNLAEVMPSCVASEYIDSVGSAVSASGVPRKRRAPAGDQLLARVAHLYTVALSSGSRTPARDVEEQLRAEGAPVSARGGRDQVRKWIQRARQRDMLPPA
ncbi:hypothetical protein GCM10028775_19090 [Catellatospora paridis]